jgi:hypothetical protein
MKHLLMPVLTVSLMLCMAAAILPMAGSKGVHIAGIGFALNDGTIIIYNREPGLGRLILDISSNSGPPKQDHTIYIQDVPGFYFCWLRDPPYSGWWAIYASAWWLSPLVLLVLVLGYRRSRTVWSTASRGRCASCGYDLRATPNRCPECGTVIGE